MNRLYFFRKRETKRPILQKNATQSLLQGVVILSFWLLSICSVQSQTAPNISYATPQNYLLNAAITDLAPANSGGTIPALTYKKVTTFAGSTAGFLDGTGTAAKMDGPLGMKMDASGNIYFIDGYNFRIRKLNTQTGAVTTIAGDGHNLFFSGRLKNDPNGALASFNYPTDLALDTANNCLYVADKENDVIRKVSLVSPYAVTTFAGSGTSSSLDGPGTAATFKKPNGIAIDPTNTYLYVTDRSGNKIRRITISTVAVTTIAGSGTKSTLDNATGISATFNDPTGIAVDANFIYVTDFGGHKIRKISKTSPYAVTTLAGSGTSGTADNTNAALATFDNPYGLTIDPAGNLFVAEWGNKIRKITSAGVVTTFAGSGASSSSDGIGAAATFDSPSNIIINPTTGVGYVSEWLGDRIRKIDLSGYELPASPALPAGLNFDSTTGAIRGTPTVINNGPVSYTVTANNYYGSSTATVSLTTATLPVLTTTVASTITDTMADTGGNVTATGGSALLEKGICWSTTANPTISNTKVVNESTEIGTYASTLIGLTPLTTIYVRAYATNALGTNYGTQVSFTTLMPSPAISYSTPNQFVINTAITPLQVTNSGGAISSTGSYVTTFAGSGTSGSADGTGTAASFNSPFGIVVAADGNFYVAENGSQKIRKITPSGEVTTFAGNGGYGAINGVGTAASFSNPSGMVIDANGNLFVADRSNHKIRKITPAGLVTTFAGSETAGSTDGTGNAASFANPVALAIDRIGNIYVADQDNHKIRRITTEGVVTTVAGNGTAASIDGVGTSASFFLPRGLVIDAADNIYVAGYDKKIRKITPAGVVSTFAGSGEQGTTDGTGNAASFGNLNGLTIDAIGNLYVTDVTYNKIRKITASGVVTSVAGGNLGSTNGLGTQARFASPLGITIDTSTGSLYIADNINNSIRKIAFNSYSITPALPVGLVLNTNGSISGTPTVASPTTTYTITAINAGGSSSFTVSIAVVFSPPAISYTATNQFTVNEVITPLQVTNTGGSINTVTGVTTIAGTGVQGSLDGSASEATFYRINSLSTDNQGQVYIADNGNGLNRRLRKLDTFGNITTMYSSYNDLSGVAVDQTGNIYTSESYSLIKKKPHNGSSFNIFATTNINGVANSSYVESLAVDQENNVYFTDVSSHRIGKISPTGVVSTFAGGSAGYLDGFGTAAKFSFPKFLTIDSNSNLFFLDSNNGKIRKIDASGNVSTVAAVLQSGQIDGPLATAKIHSADGLAADKNGDLYFLDRNYVLGISKIRKLSNGKIYTIAGGSKAFIDGSLAEASFTSLAYCMTIDNNGDLYITDSYRIRKIVPNKFKISPDLPSGLVLNADGSISGKPTVLSPATDYIVSVVNAGGTSSTTVNIAVTTAIPTWTGTEWINGLVAKNAPAIIAGNYSSVGNLEIGELTIKNNASVVFQSGHNLTINGKLTVEAGGTLTLDSNSNLLQTTNVTNSGSITVKRQTAPLKLLDYVLWSSPVSGQLLQSFSPATLSTRFYKYDSNIDKYSTVSIPSASAFEGGDGYLIRMPNDHPNTPTIWTGIFTGIPNNGTLSIPIFGSGYIAIGNPYPSAIDADAFIAGNNISEPLYFWRKTNNAANPSYATYTLAGGVGTANSADQNGLIPNGTIQVGQGFITQLNYTDVVFRNTMRIINNNNQFLRTKKTDKSRIWLNLTTTSGFFSQAMVAYMDGATSGIDAAIDGRYFNDCPTALTSIITNEEFSIQGRSLPFDTSDVVPLGFKTETAGEFSLAIDHTDGLFAAGQKVFLKDNVTNTVNDLSTGTYKFTTEAGVFNSRFAIVYQNTLGIDDADALSNQVMVYKQNDKISIDAGSIIMAGIKVYDLNGRLLFERKNINTNQFVFSIATATDVLLIKMTSNDGQAIAKKIIN